MKTFRYILSIALLLAGFFIGWFVFGQSFVNWGAASEEPVFDFLQNPNPEYLSHDSPLYYQPFSAVNNNYPFFPLLFKFLFGLTGFLLISFIAIKIWPENIDESIRKFILPVSILILTALPFALISILGLYWLDWSTGDRDYFIHIMPYCGCFSGFVMWMAIFSVLIVVRLVQRSLEKRQEIN